MAELPHKITLEFEVDTKSLNDAISQIENAIRSRENWLQRLARKLFRLSP